MILSLAARLGARPGLKRSVARFPGLIRAFSGHPWDTNYYELATDDVDLWLGAKRVESSRIEALMRQIGQRLLLHDAAQSALLDQEILNDHSAYLSQFVDARDVAPRTQPIGQNELSHELRRILKEDHDGLLAEVGQVFWQHQIRRTSTYHMTARRLLELGYPAAAQMIMQSFLMAFQLPELKASTATLCLELAMTNHDRKFFFELAKKCDPRDPKVAVMLAEGYMKFRRPDLLDSATASARGTDVYVNLLAVNIEAAKRWKDLARGERAFASFEKCWDPHKIMSARVLLLAMKIPELQERVSRLVPQLGPRQRRFFLSKRSAYYHPYANYTPTNRAL